MDDRKLSEQVRMCGGVVNDNGVTPWDAINLLKKVVNTNAKVLSDLCKQREIPKEKGCKGIIIRVETIKGKDYVLYQDVLRILSQMKGEADD